MRLVPLGILVSLESATSSMATTYAIQPDGGAALVSEPENSRERVRPLIGHGPDRG